MLLLDNAFSVTFRVLHDISITKTVLSMNTINFNTHDDWSCATLENGPFLSANFKDFCSIYDNLVQRRIPGNTCESNNIEMVEGCNNTLSIINTTVCINDIWFF